MERGPTLLLGAAENPFGKVWYTPLPTKKREKKGGGGGNLSSYTVPLCMWKLSRSEFGITCQFLQRYTGGKLLPSFLFPFKEVSSLSTNHGTDTWEFVIWVFAQLLLGILVWHNGVQVWNSLVRGVRAGGAMRHRCSVPAHRSRAWAVLTGSTRPVPRQPACTAVSVPLFAVRTCYHWCSISATPVSRKSQFNN